MKSFKKNSHFEFLGDFTHKECRELIGHAELISGRKGSPSAIHEDDVDTSRKDELIAEAKISTGRKLHHFNYPNGVELRIRTVSHVPRETFEFKKR